MSLSLPEPTPSDRSHARAERDKAKAKVEQALSIYRIMAWVTGTMLLVLCVEMVLKYIVKLNGFGEPVFGSWVAILHGIIYVLYLVSVFNLWSHMRWSFGRLVFLGIAGVVPILSFILERKATHWVEEDLPAHLEAVEARALRRAQISRLKAPQENS